MYYTEYSYCNGNRGQFADRLAFAKYYVDVAIEKKISLLSKPYLVALNEALDSMPKLRYAMEYKDDTSM